MPASKPTNVRLPGIDVTSPVHGLGLDDQGKLKVPSGDKYDEVAWYDGSPTPGESGPSVIEGHVTGSGHRKSVFFELGATKAGDRVEVDRADGSTATFKVTKVNKYQKADFPRIDVYGATKGPELRVITCGGTYDEAAGRHLDNIVVFAELVEK
ncbi:class F sortase [Janibacter sp. GS2]|uniref:class F sortase n=1 Tax=Janibacter sp. GS2 TaxID=3442646 RepID=UPI003EBC143B